MTYPAPMVIGRIRRVMRYSAAQVIWYLVAFSTCLAIVLAVLG